MNPTNLESQNANIQALEVLSCLNNMRIVQQKITFNLLIAVYRGSNRKEIVGKSVHEIPQFGYGKAVFSDSALKESVHMLIAEDVIVEELRTPNEAGSHPYLACGNKAELLKQSSTAKSKLYISSSETATVQSSLLMPNMLKTFWLKEAKTYFFPTS